MPITSQDVQWAYDGDSVTVDFPYDNLITAASDLEVYVDGTLKTLTTDYSVTNVGVVTGGNVVFTGAPAIGVKNVVITSAIPNTQSTNLIVGGTFSSSAITAALDRLTRLVQQLFFRSTRTIRLDDSDPSAALAPLPQNRALQFAGFDVNGNLIPFGPGGAPLAGRVATTTPVTCLNTDDLVAVHLAIVGSATIHLPANPVPGQEVTIKDDSGTAQAHNNTIDTTDGSTIDGAATLTQRINHQSNRFKFNGTQWNVVG